mmetsp:Transcript_55123/g.83411  ORF Transcript_55123/g.83411 Transcript_55123/m.83411 type:complete len:497 (+) Transcript_55123:91-1581(+)|eukprot:CAMPEP_0117044100 /NCGR_PEP_ID=MMETSP0472-20121206/30592_1 /TAXON_ID=693140 ORGANISM="Tiarina fusus, Strain LIS" /NCGR_SAMPLE_ID=MMETSP0472 /ASSEMBLY_ACC=CAM_ASM_000603 /LENGTH=496 /DNA_ID=CAMNT_0004755755 /DNA_START=78 /DNA_END=1568 /DNA_ORIENTATION=+
MKISPHFLTLCLAASVRSFAPTPAFTNWRSGVAPSDTVLYISSWGTKGSPARGDTTENKNPLANIQSYLKAPDSVEARNTIDGTVMVSGLVKTTERTDQFIFDLLNHEESAFEFDKIVAFVDDVKFAKKRLLSRSARYTGLLDKLDFVEAESAGGLPSKEQLAGIKSWVAYLEGDSMLADLEKVAATVKSVSGLENVAVLLAGAVELDAAASEAALKALKDAGVQYTVVAVGNLEDHDEGKIPYKYAEFGTENAILPADSIFSRDEALRMVTECLQLECGVNKAWAFSEVYEVNATEAKLIKGLREAGYARPQEIDHMMRDGPANYQKAIDEFQEANPDHAKGYYTTEAWWEDEEFQKSVKARSLREDAEIQKVEDDRTAEIEKIAKEWAKREYFRLSMEGSIEDGTSEEDFTKSNWDRALFEADLKYRQLNGEITDAGAEAALEDFKAQQERKKQTMLQRAKEELKDLLDEEDLGGDDLNEKLERLEADADNTEK